MHDGPTPEPPPEPTDLAHALRQLARQEQFLDVVDQDEAARRFHRHLSLRPLGPETVTLSHALGRVLAEPLVAAVDVPGFDRASVDGFAVRADDTRGASAQAPCVLKLNLEILTPGTEPRVTVAPGSATLIATGGMVPRGADAVVMVEHTEAIEREGATWIEVQRPVAAGQFVAFAGSDLARGETALRTGQVLSSREIGIAAAIGRETLEVYRKPRVAVISTGDELIAPGRPMRAGAVYDSNGAILAAAVEEAGGTAMLLGIGPDDDLVLARLVDEGLKDCDVVVLSGGTSKGAGDLCFRAVAQFRDPGIVVHGVALKPGKPVCLAVTRHKPVVVLPGFPTSAIFTFHAFVAPVIRALAGRPEETAARLPASLPLRVPSERGRTEFLMVSLVPGDRGALAAYPIAKGSGSVTSFSSADGFIAIPADVESVPAGAPVDVQLIGSAIKLADLVIMGSHCVGLDIIIDKLQADGLTVKALNIGSTGGLAAAKRGECDVAAMHLMDDATGVYNTPFLTDALALVPGYRRMQGIVFRPDDLRFEEKTLEQAVAALLEDPDCIMVNRNAGSGTRILIDRLLKGARPPGYWAQPKSHGAVAVAVAQRRADWGMAIASVARQYELGFIPVQEEHYDFVVPRARHDRPAVQRFFAALADERVRAALRALGFALVGAAR